MTQIVIISDAQEYWRRMFQEKRNQTNVLLGEKVSVHNIKIYKCDTWVLTSGQRVEYLSEFNEPVL